MTKLVKYEIIKAPGRGGFDVVYQARNTSLDHFVALKVLYLQLTTNADFLRRFHQEARDLARIEHPNVVMVHEINEAEGKVFMVIQYLSGDSCQFTCDNDPQNNTQSVPLIYTQTEPGRACPGIGASRCQTRQYPLQ